MNDSRSPLRGRPALTGWAAAALAVSGSLVLPACAGDTINQPVSDGGTIDSGSSDATSESIITGGGICAVWVDATAPDAGPDADGASDDAQADAPFGGGICATTAP